MKFNNVNLELHHLKDIDGVTYNVGDFIRLIDVYEKGNDTAEYTIVSWIPQLSCFAFLTECELYDLSNYTFFDDWLKEHGDFYSCSPDELCKHKIIGNVLSTNNHKLFQPWLDSYKYLFINEEIKL